MIKDIFKRLTVLPDGKNHGLMMFINWSGSMSDKLFDTINDELNNLILSQENLTQIEPEINVYMSELRLEKEKIRLVGINPQSRSRNEIDNIEWGLSSISRLEELLEPGLYKPAEALDIKETSNKPNPYKTTLRHQTTSNIQGF